MKVPLHEHQVVGVAWMLNKESSKDRGGILADDMGLGKVREFYRSFSALSFVRFVLLSFISCFCRSFV